MSSAQRLFIRRTFLVIVILPFICSDGFAGKATSLDGQWFFAVDSGGQYTIATVRSRGYWRSITVPGSWQTQFEDLRDYQGVGWYRKSFDTPRMRRGETVVLTFGAVDYRAEVFVNGSKIGVHDGGYTPFRFEIGDVIKPGPNEVIVRVMDPVGDGNGTEGVNYKNIPHGKQSWYVQTSGLWQSVWLDVVTPRRITQMEVTPETTGVVDVALRLSAPIAAAAHNRLEIRILDYAGSVIARTRASIAVRDSLARVRLEVNDPALWSPDAPSLYQIEAVLDANAPVRDRFGFRLIETGGGKILLNGRPFFLIGALDQDFYPDNIYSTPSEAYLRDEMTKAKRLGLNILRCHIKAPDPIYLKVADEVGLLVWYEIPNWDVYTPEAGQRGERTLREMLERDWNHPSLVILSIINESWGVDLRKGEQRAWLRGVFDRVKNLAKGRLVVDNSACEGNFHLKTDLNDWHTYYAMPDRRKEFDSVVTALAARPSWLFSPHGDAVTSGKEPLLLSEFGTWGLPKIPEPAPWWMGRRFGNAEVVFPQGYAERFARYDLQSVFGSYREMLGVSQRAQSDALKYQIERLRGTPGIEGYVITEFTDINWECNGLLDMWRNIKECGKVLPAIQQQDVIVARPGRFAWWSDERPTVDIRCSRYSAESAPGVQIHWWTSCGDSGSIVLGSAPAGSVTVVPSMQLPRSGVLPGGKLKVNLQMLSMSGRVLAANDLDLAVYSREPMKGTEAGSSVVVSSTLDSVTLAALQHGGDALLLMDSTTIFPAGFPMVAVRRDTGWYDGNWSSVLNWVRNDRGPFKGVCPDRRFGFESEGATMPYAVRGVDPRHFDDVLAGLFVGWVQRHAAYVVQIRVGKGKLIVCAIPLQRTVAADPFSAVLLSRLRQYLLSSECQPKWAWNP